MRLVTRVRNRPGEILMDLATGGALLLLADRPVHPEGVDRA